MPETGFVKHLSCWRGGNGNYMMFANSKNDLAETHDAVWKILPWHVNGTLAEDEQRLVAQHLRECLMCKRETDALSQLASAMENRVHDVACENALARLHARIDERTPSSYIPWAAVASMVIIVGLVFIATNRVTQGLVDFSSGYQTLGRNPDPVSNHVNRSARIIFRAEVEAAEMVSLLDTVDASIAAGPSRRGGVYHQFCGYTFIFRATPGNSRVTQERPRTLCRARPGNTR